jgi:hypothetical protein
MMDFKTLHEQGRLALLSHEYQPLYRLFLDGEQVWETSDYTAIKGYYDGWQARDGVEKETR